MRTVLFLVLISSIPILSPHRGQGAEYFARIIQEEWNLRVSWRYSHLQYVDIQSIRVWEYEGKPMSWSEEDTRLDELILDKDELLSKLRSKMMENRSIVIRTADKMPTWDGNVPAFIIEPSIWYFDPNSPVQKMNFQAWMNAVPDTTALLPAAQAPTAHRTLIDFLVEDYEKHQSQKHTHSYDGLRMYR